MARSRCSPSDLESGRGTWIACGALGGAAAGLGGAAAGAGGGAAEGTRGALTARGGSVGSTRCGGAECTGRLGGAAACGDMAACWCSDEDEAYDRIGPPGGVPVAAGPGGGGLNGGRCICCSPSAGPLRARGGLRAGLTSLYSEVSMNAGRCELSRTCRTGRGGDTF